MDQITIFVSSTIAEINDVDECNEQFSNNNEYETHVCERIPAIKPVAAINYDGNVPQSTDSNKSREESDEDCATVGRSPSATHVGEIYVKASESKTASRKSMVYACKYCDWRSTRKREIQPHRRMHEEQMNFKCILCNKSFLTEKGLKSHNKGHIRYKCGLCQNKFVFKTKFNQHFKEKHVKKRQHAFKCGECHESFTTKQRLLIHELGHPKHTCGLCDKSFKQRFQLCQHSKETHNIELRRREMSRRCVAYGCNNTTAAILRRSLHSFPNPNRQPVRYRIWVNNVNTTRKNFQPPPFAKKSAFYRCVLCSDHFTKDSFERKSSVNELCNFRTRATLKEAAIPTIFTKLSS